MLVRDARLAAIVAARDALVSSPDSPLLAELNRRIDAYLRQDATAPPLPFLGAPPSFDATATESPPKRRRCDAATLEMAKLEREVNMLRPLVRKRAHGILRDADAALVVVDPAEKRVLAPNDDQCVDGRVGILQRLCREIFVPSIAGTTESCSMCLEPLCDLFARDGELVRVDPACLVCSGLRRAEHPATCALARHGACIACVSSYLARAWQQRDEGISARAAYDRHGSGVPCPLCRGTICEDDLVIVRRRRRATSM